MRNQASNVSHLLRIAMFGIITVLVCAGCTDATQSESSSPADTTTPVKQTQPKPQRTPATTSVGKTVVPKRAPQRHAAKPAGQAAVIDHVVDGDTVALTTGVRVRLVQIDTPEVYGRAECGGAAASAALKQQLPPGTKVRLVADPALDSTDHYGRQLRYIYLRQRNLNVWMVQRGHAAPWYYGGDRGRYSGALDQAVAGAKLAQRGTWKSCPAAALDTSRSFSTGAPRGGANDAAAGAGALHHPASHRSNAHRRNSAAGLPAAPPYPPDVNCSDLSGPVRVTPDDPHGLDGDGDGVGCD